MRKRTPTEWRNDKTVGLFSLDFHKQTPAKWRDDLKTEMERCIMFACWFQAGLISHGTIFSSHNKPAPAGLINLETNQRTG